MIRAVFGVWEQASRFMRLRLLPALWRLSGSTGRGLAALARRIVGITLAAGDRVMAAVPALGGLSSRQRTAVTASVVGVGLLVGGVTMLRSGSHVASGITALNPFKAEVVEGRATALDGETLKINGTVVRLAGIEAPAPGQKCTNGRKRWACGEAAHTALQRVVRAKPVRCELSGTDDSGRPLASCRAGADGVDVAEELVREGAVFAETSLFGGYVARESEAKAAAAGIWKGEAERPSDYRAKVWEVAAKSAPDGCPIKGQVAGEAKTYLLPWQSDYNGVRIRAARGERWFCSEAEAQAAGWKVAIR